MAYVSLADTEYVRYDLQNLRAVQLYQIAVALQEKIDRLPADSDLACSLISLLEDIEFSLDEIAKAEKREQRIWGSIITSSIQEDNTPRVWGKLITGN